MLPGGGLPPLNMRRAILIPAAAGTIFGNMTNNGGHAAAFDGNTSHASGACAAGTASVDAFIGKSFASPRIFHSAMVHGSSDFGFFWSGNPGMTLRIYGKKGAAPASAFDGTEVGFFSLTDTGNEAAGRAISSNDLHTAWDHIWLAYHNGGSNTALCAELILNEYAG